MAGCSLFVEGNPVLLEAFPDLPWTRKPPGEVPDPPARALVLHSHQHPESWLSLREGYAVTWWANVYQTSPQALPLRCRRPQ